MNDNELAYAEGFVQKCEAIGVDPVPLLKQAFPAAMLVPILKLLGSGIRGGTKSIYRGGVGGVRGVTSRFGKALTGNNTANVGRRVFRAGTGGTGGTGAQETAGSDGIAALLERLAARTTTLGAGAAGLGVGGTAAIRGLSTD